MNIKLKTNNMKSLKYLMAAKTCLEGALQYIDGYTNNVGIENLIEEVNELMITLDINDDADLKVGDIIKNHRTSNGYGWYLIIDVNEYAEGVEIDPVALEEFTIKGKDIMSLTNKRKRKFFAVKCIGGCYDEKGTKRYYIKYSTKDRINKLDGMS